MSDSELNDMGVPWTVVPGQGYGIREHVLEALKALDDTTGPKIPTARWHLQSAVELRESSLTPAQPQYILNAATLRELLAR